ncbi:MAG: hypothetical protein HOP09_10155 [Hyphomicrobium sp.]|nr:hypothetical protein [Hyphomicrobium sp.]
MSNWKLEIRGNGLIANTQIPHILTVFINCAGVEVGVHQSRDSWQFKYRSHDLLFSFSASQRPPAAHSDLTNWNPLALGPDCTVRVGPRSFSREIQQGEKLRLWNDIVSLLGNIVQVAMAVEPLPDVPEVLKPILGGKVTLFLSGTFGKLKRVETVQLIAGSLGFYERWVIKPA